MPSARRISISRPCAACLASLVLTNCALTLAPLRRRLLLLFGRGGPFARTVVRRSDHRDLDRVRARDSAQASRCRLERRRECARYRGRYCSIYLSYRSCKNMCCFSVSRLPTAVNLPSADFMISKSALPVPYPIETNTRSSAIARGRLTCGWPSLYG